ncbi:MAG: hypothetical protein NC324_00915 [Bacteroides sp.]|nr:hypothetical protein [Bacteroides sp.]
MKWKLLTLLPISLFAGLAVSCSDENENKGAEEETYRLTVVAGEGGEVFVEKDFYAEGEQVRVRAAADDGYVFAGWYESDAMLSEEEVYLFEMPARDMALQARFEAMEVSVSVEAVDLGLSVKWAPWNVGASALEEYGGLYGWADPTGEKNTTEFDDYPSANPPADICGTEYDIARTQWGDGWRMPSQAEFQELVENCTWEWTEVNGIQGCRATAANGNSIFFPAAASRDGQNVSNQVGQRGCYWSGTLYPDNDRFAYYFYFYDKNQYADRNNRRYMGYSVRPVKE